MANFVEAMGYSLGKLHTGMLCYMCSLWNEGIREPLESFLNTLNIPLPETRPLIAAREWNSIDLVILNVDNTPYLVVEMKVDDYEHEVVKTVAGVKQRAMQTALYPKMVPGSPKFLFITLGTGEYYAPPSGKEFCWIRVRTFLNALNSIKTDDKLIHDWRQSVENEIKRQDLAYKNDRSSIDGYRTGTWNIYVLGFLKDDLLRDKPGLADYIAPTAYMYGARPDTILNFGWSKYPLYMEINNSGLLNVKANIEDIESDHEKKGFIEASIANLTGMFNGQPFFINQRSGYGKSKTLLSIDIGMTNIDGVLAVEDRNKTISTLAKALESFYR